MQTQRCAAGAPSLGVERAPTEVLAIAKMPASRANRYTRGRCDATFDRVALSAHVRPEDFVSREKGSVETSSPWRCHAVSSRRLQRAAQPAQADQIVKLSPHCRHKLNVFHSVAGQQGSVVMCGVANMTPRRCACSFSESLKRWVEERSRWRTIVMRCPAVGDDKNKCMRTRVVFDWDAPAEPRCVGEVGV